MNKGRREGQGERANNNKEFSYVFVWCLFRSLIGPKSGQNPKKKKHPNLQPHNTSFPPTTTTTTTTTTMDSGVRQISSEHEITDTIRNKKDQLIVIDYYADWCGPCRRLAPRFDEWSRQYPQVIFLKVNVDQFGFGVLIEFWGLVFFFGKGLVFWDRVCCLLFLLVRVAMRKGGRPYEIHLCLADNDVEGFDELLEKEIHDLRFEVLCQPVDEVAREYRDSFVVQFPWVARLKDREERKSEQIKFQKAEMPPPQPLDMEAVYAYGCNLKDPSDSEDDEKEKEDKKKDKKKSKDKFSFAPHRKQDLEESEYLSDWSLSPANSDSDSLVWGEVKQTSDGTIGSEPSVGTTEEYGGLGLYDDDGDGEDDGKDDDEEEDDEEDDDDDEEDDEGEEEEDDNEGVDLYEGEGTEESGPVGEGNEEKGGDSVPQLLTYGEEDGEGEDLIGVTGSGYNAWDGGKGEREKKLKEEERKARKARRKKRKEKKARREMKRQSNQATDFFHNVRQSMRLGAQAWEEGAEEEGLESEENQYRDWNEQFQLIMEEICCMEKWETLQDKSELNNSLLQLIQDFNSVAKMYGRIIIMERFLTTAQEACIVHGPNWMEKKVVVKTIPPSSSFHGIAGGEKYFVNNILFKFAVDVHGLYGSDHFAAKAAGLELLGNNAYFNTNTPGLHLPLVTLVNFLGYRLVAVSLIPIRSGSGPESTLVYGSQDGGRTVKNSDPIFEALAKYTANKLGLRSHYVKGREQKESVELHTAFDVEGHLGIDGRFYMLDLARGLPSDPVNQLDWFKGCQQPARLVSRFRPEFMHNYFSISGKLLTPDSPHEVGIGKTDPQFKSMYADIKNAAKHLRNNCIDKVVESTIYSFLSSMHRKANASSSSLASPPALSTSSASEATISRPRNATSARSPPPSSPPPSSTPSSFVSPSPFEEVDIPALFHGNGVNLRYLGRVFDYICHANRNFLRDPRAFIPVAVLVCVEAVARAIKNFVNQHFRVHMKRLAMSVEAPYRILLLNELNVFFRYDDDAMARKETEANWNAIRMVLQNTLGFIDDQQVDFCLALVRGKFHPSSEIGRGVNVKIQGTVFTAAAVQGLLVQADTELGATPLYLLFSRLVQVMNLEFSDVAMKQFLVYSPMLKLQYSKQGGSIFSREAAKPFSLADLSKIRVKVKGMKIGMNAQANFYHSQGIVVEKRTGGKSTALHHYTLAESLYKKIISFHPQDVETRYNLCVTQFRMLLLKFKTPKGDVSFDLSNPEIHALERELGMLKSQAQTDPRLRNLMGKFYAHCHSFQKAEYNTLKAIQYAPQSEEYLISYAEILKKSKLHMLSTIFETRAILIGNIITKTRQLILNASHSHDMLKESIESELDIICAELESVTSNLQKSLFSSIYSPMMQKIAFGLKKKEEVAQRVNEIVLQYNQLQHQQQSQFQNTASMTDIGTFGEEKEETHSKKKTKFRRNLKLLTK